MKFIAGDQSPKPMQPGEESLYRPAFAIAAQLATILRLLPVLTIRRDQLNAVFFLQAPVERVRIIGFVAEDAFGEFVQEAAREGFLYELRFVRRGAIHVDGQRNTGNSGDGHDFRGLASLRLADRKAPFFALLNVASIKLSAKSSSPRSRIRSANRRNTLRSRPSRTHCWKRRWQVWYGGYRSGISHHRAPLPSTHSTPLSTLRVSCHGRPRPSGRRRGLNTGSIKSHSWSPTSQPLAMRLCGVPEHLYHRAFPIRTQAQSLPGLFMRWLASVDNLGARQGQSNL